MDLRVSLYVSEGMDYFLCLPVLVTRKVQSVVYWLYQLRYPRRKLD